ncbi:MAG: hypothetical protein ACPGU1_21345 [Myxococcota bacterium]
MSEDRPSIEINQDIVLTDEADASFVVAVTELSASESGVQLEGTMSCETWAQVVESDRFGLSPAVLPHGGPELLDTERPVTVRLRLHEGLPEGLALPDIAAQLLSGEGEASEEDAWVLCEALQDVALPEGVEGTAQAGFRTNWAEDTPEGGSELEELTAAWLAQAGAEVAMVQPGLMRVPMEADGHEWVLLARVDAGARIVGFYSIFPTLVPEEARYLTALFMMGQNFDIPFGAFEMDPEDGELRFRTAWAGGPEELPTGAQLYELVAPHAPLMSAHMNVVAELAEQAAEAE